MDNCQIKSIQAGQEKLQTVDAIEKISFSERQIFQTNLDFQTKKEIENENNPAKDNICNKKHEVKSLFVSYLSGNLKRNLLDTNQKLVIDEKIECEIRQLEERTFNESYQCLVNHELTDRMWRNVFSGKLKALERQYTLTCTELTSSVKWNKRVFFFGTTLQDGSFGYVTLVGRGNAYKFLPSNVDPASINIDNDEEINDPRAFYLQSPSSSSSGLLVSASNLQLYARLSSLTNEVIADYSGDEWFIRRTS